MKLFAPKYIIPTVRRDVNFMHNNDNNMDVYPTPHNTIEVTKPVAGLTTVDVGLMLNKRGLLIRRN